jgi:hypothetical protein
MSDFFGKTNPRRMPEHLFWGALHINYPTAVGADISKQDYSVCPRYWYVDAAFRCARCGETFVFSADEQRFWYQELGFHIDSHARHCQTCRRDLRELKSLRQEYDGAVTQAMAKNADIDQKRRVVGIIDALTEGGVELPGKIRENRVVLMKQIEGRAEDSKEP